MFLFSISILEVIGISTVLLLVVSVSDVNAVGFVGTERFILVLVVVMDFGEIVMLVVRVGFVVRIRIIRGRPVFHFITFCLCV